MPPKVKDFYIFLEELAPLKLAEKGDVNGLQIGSFEEEVRGILLAINPTLETFQIASAKNLNLIITHHPLFYRPLARVCKEEYPGNILYFAIKEKLNLLSWHTPLDKVSFGVSEALAQTLKWKTEDFVLKEEQGYGYGRVVKFKKYVKLSTLANQVKRTLNTWVMVVGDPESKINKIALCGGSGGFLKEHLLKQGIQTLLTSDVKYHQAIEARESGFNYILIDHGISESLLLDTLKKKITDFLNTKGLHLPVEVFREESPYIIL